MPNYRRFYQPGSTVFLTWVTYHRKTLFAESNNIHLFRQAVQRAKSEQPFDIDAAVILPEHVHFILTFPSNDNDYSKRVGRIKALFTKALKNKDHALTHVSPSRRKHRESDVWQRRFWEHTIRNEEEYKCYLDYIHYNPVKHGLVRCPHLWQYSSFHKWVGEGHYCSDWACQCNGETDFKLRRFEDIALKVGE
ncbi:MAG: transposase [Leptolyngbyaceae bacterium]|nr:transposase [Leptolyngbyaceae bacterium]